MKKIFLILLIFVLSLTSCKNDEVEDKTPPKLHDVKSYYGLKFFNIYDPIEFDYFEENKVYCYIVDNVDTLLSANKIKLYESNKNKREWNALQYSLDYYKVDSKYKMENDTSYYLLSSSYYCLNDEKKEYFKDFMAIVQKNDNYIIIVK